MTLIEVELQDQEQSSVWVNVEDISRFSASKFGGTSITLHDGAVLNTPEKLDAFIQRMKSTLGVIVADRI